jgi:hypothetical protein
VGASIPNTWLLRQETPDDADAVFSIFEAIAFFMQQFI